jgi:hypothetical protein
MHHIKSVSLIHVFFYPFVPFFICLKRIQLFDGHLHIRVTRARCLIKLPHENRVFHYLSCSNLPEPVPELMWGRFPA